MTKNELYQSLWKRYSAEHNHQPTGTRMVVEWALKQGLLELPPVDPRDILASQMAQALRSETAIDSHGRSYRVNHAVKVMQNGTQMTFWGMMGFADRSFMEKTFTQRREQIVGDCLHLKIDVDAYNELNPAEVPIQTELNFTEDVVERLVVEEPIAA